MIRAPQPERGEAWQPYAPGPGVFADLATRVHVWRIRLDGVPEQIGEKLSEDERTRALRFARPEDRHRFVVARGVLRTVLADILGDGADPSGRRLRFGYGPAGKPVLADAPGLHFNLSHSEDLAVIAVSRAGEVGIDVERQRPVDDMSGIARLMFDEAERAALLGSPASTRETAFYRIWTRKEALLKAMGTGIAGLGDTNAPSLAHAGTAWHVTMLPHLDGFAAALARPRGTHGPRLWSWPGSQAMRSAERRARPRPAPTASCEAFR